MKKVKIFFLFFLLASFNIFSYFTCIDFNLNNKNFVTYNLTNKISQNTIGIKAYLLNKYSFDLSLFSANTIVLSNCIFWALLYPYHSEITEINKLITQNQKKDIIFEKAKRLRSIILEMNFTESFIVELAEAYIKTGNHKKYIIKSSTLDEKLDEIIDKEYCRSTTFLEISEFRELINSLKYFFSCFFSQDVINFYLNNNIDVSKAIFATIIQEKIKYGSPFQIQNNKPDNFLNNKKIKKINEYFKDKKNQLRFEIDKNNNLYLLDISNYYNSQSTLNNYMTYGFNDFKKKFFARIAVFGILKKDNKILLLKQKINPFRWRPPGGGLKGDENIIEGLIREIKEDTFLDVDVIKLADVWRGTLGVDNKVVTLLFICKPLNDDIKVSDEFFEYKWVTFDQLKNTIYESAFDISSWSKFIND